MVSRSISIDSFRRLYQDQPGLFMIDVRNPAEYDSGHLRGARSYPLPALDPQQIAADWRQSGLDEPVYVLCQAGMRAQIAAQLLVSAANLAVMVVEGGANACIQCGLPMQQGQA